MKNPRSWTALAVFTAFGALHLSGQDGVLNLLQKEGYALKELPF